MEFRRTSPNGLRARKLLWAVLLLALLSALLLIVSVSVQYHLQFVFAACHLSQWT